MMYSTKHRIILGCLVVLLFGLGLVVSQWDYLSSTERMENEINIFSQPKEFFLIDINTASLDELSLVPEISKKIAGKIITYREKRGKIEDIQELLVIKGIGEVKLKKIQKYLKPLTH
jgi:competence ComEA-like helix-hairpin-helix protein